MMQYICKNYELDGVVLMNAKKFIDNRGVFFESYNEQQLVDIIGLPHKFVQDNFSISKKNVFRGFHYQDSDNAQGKLVSVIKGKVIDIIIDIRRYSKTFGQHLKFELSAENGDALWIPRGFAHGFISLEEDTIFHYKVDNLYNKESERSISLFDAELNLELDKMGYHMNDFNISDKDRTAGKLSTTNYGY